MIGSGAEEGDFKVWDLRMVSKGNEPIAFIKWHHD